jgi:hypothetical protein
MGFLATYMNCVNACKRLKEEFYGNEYSQYSLIPSYVEELKKNGHKACYDTVNGTFSRLAIVYCERLKSFSEYPSRGLSIDGTFLKAHIGGILLAACFRNGNNELQIVGVAVVSIENETN